MRIHKAVKVRGSFFMSHLLRILIAWQKFIYCNSIYKKSSPQYILAPKLHWGIGTYAEHAAPTLLLSPAATGVFLSFFWAFQPL